MSPARHLRRRAVLWSAPVVVGVVVVALRLLSLGVINESGQRLLDDGSPAAAADRFGLIGPLDVVERWIQPFNTGIARHVDEDFVAAEDRFRAALDRAPDGAVACRVRHNLAVSIEAQGDAAADDREVGDARERWTTALDVVTAGGCLDRDDEIGDRFADDEERLRAKLDPDGDGGHDDDGGRPPPTTSPDGPDDATRDQLDDLEEQTSDAIEQDRLDQTFERRRDDDNVGGDRW